MPKREAASRRLADYEEKQEDGVQDFGRILLKDLAKLNQDDPPFCDVTFLIGEDGVEMQSVKAILALQSDFFAGLFFGNMAEAQETNPEMTYSDIDPAVFRIFLNFMHNGKLIIPPEANKDDMMESLLTLADRFDVKHLFGALYSFQEREYNDDNVMHFIHLGERFRDEVLLTDATGYLMKYGERLFSNQEFVNALPMQRLCEFLARDDLRANELTLFNAVLGWGENQLEAEIKEEIELQAVVAEPLSHIRFALIPAPTLIEDFLPKGIIDQDMLIRALAFQADKKHFGEQWGVKRRRGVIHGTSLSLTREEVIAKRSEQHCPSGYGSTHDGGACVAHGKIFAHYGNDGNMGDRVHVSVIDEGDDAERSTIDLPFGTHGSYPISSEEFVYVYEDSDNAHGPGFGRINADTLDFERLADAPGQHLRFSSGCYQNGRVWKAITTNSIVSYAPENDAWTTHTTSVSSACHMLADPVNSDLIWVLEQGGSLKQYSISQDAMIVISNRPAGFNLGANYPTLIAARTGDEKSDDDGVLIMSYSSSAWSMYDSVLGQWDNISWDNIGEGGHVCGDGASRRVFLQTNNSNHWHVINYDDDV